VAYQHEQEEQDLLQQYGDVFFQQSHSADVHGTGHMVRDTLFLEV
jgi:hypothetical protein